MEDGGWQLKLVCMSFQANVNVYCNALQSGSYFILRKTTFTEVADFVVFCKQMKIYKRKKKKNKVAALSVEQLLKTESETNRTRKSSLLLFTVLPLKSKRRYTQTQELANNNNNKKFNE